MIHDNYQGVMSGESEYVSEKGTKEDGMRLYISELKKQWKNCNLSFASSVRNSQKLNISSY